jgi:hypothetical protein
LDFGAVCFFLFLFLFFFLSEIEGKSQCIKENEGILLRAVSLLGCADAVVKKPQNRPHKSNYGRIVARRSCSGSLTLASA